MMEMSEEKVFVDGMVVKRHENAPDFVLCNLSLKCTELVEFMRQHHKENWVNIQIKRSKGGKLYAELDTWQPTQGQAANEGMGQARAAAQPDFPDDDIPF
jgi:hypothetical protein